MAAHPSGSTTATGSSPGGRPKLRPFLQQIAWDAVTDSPANGTSATVSKLMSGS
jgi:hypothetical protein